MSQLYFLGQIKPEDAEQFQSLHPGKWGVYKQGDRFFVSPINTEPFNHHVIFNKSWLKEDYGIEELLSIPHIDILKEVLENTPEEWSFKNQSGEEIIFTSKKYKEALKKEINHPSIIDDFK